MKLMAMLALILVCLLFIARGICALIVAGRKISKSGVEEATLKHLELLGYQVRDVVSGFTGVVTSISFDLYGCVQGLVTPPVIEKEGKKSGDSGWFDTKRLV